MLEANGSAGEPPIATVQEYLIDRGARSVTTILHPLDVEHGDEHFVHRVVRGAAPITRTRRLPAKPPYTYPLDLTVPFVPPRADTHLCFNSLVAARALACRRAGRVGQVVYWMVDFVPDRFGAGSPLTRAYDGLDRFVCRRADVRFEVTAPALEERTARLGLGSEAAPAFVVPMGGWVGRSPTTPPDGHLARRVIWSGHMVERQGVGRLIDAMGVLRRRDVAVTLQLVGRGPLEPQLRAQVAALGLSDVVEFTGYVAEEGRLHELLAAASVGVAPYATDMDNFSRFADPAKIKGYLTAGLPVVTTAVPPNATEVATEGGGEVVAFDGEAIADAVERILADGAGWSLRREAALQLASRYDWSVIVPQALRHLGYDA